MIPIPAMLLAAQLATPVAERVPQFNIEPTCQGAATASQAIRSTRDICLEKEKQARDDLGRQWADFPAADRGRCVQSTAAGGIPSYVQLLTCLESAKLARQLPKDYETRTTTGAGSSDSKPPSSSPTN
jgi:hypothetical protein